MKENKEAYKMENLEKNLVRLKEVTTEIDLLSRQFMEGSVDPAEAEKKLDEKVEEQKKIIDGFISLSDDRDNLERFVRTTKIIELKSKLYQEENDPEEQKKLRQETLKLLESWSHCLEQIIAGVFDKANGKE